MACTLLTSGIAKGCDNNIGGVSKIYISDFSSVSGYTGTGGTISGITMGATANLFYSFEFNRNTSSFAENAIVSAENGSLFYEQSVTLIIPRREVAKRNTLALLMQKDLAVIVKDSNGLFWVLGETNGLIVTELPTSTGTAKGDLNGYTITLKGEEPAQAQETTQSALDAVI